LLHSNPQQRTPHNQTWIGHPYDFVVVVNVNSHQPVNAGKYGRDEQKVDQKSTFVCAAAHHETPSAS
jgi:hypothetical protein